MKDDPTLWTDEKLRRKIDQAWDMAGLARADGDRLDEAKHTMDARRFAAELGRRIKSAQQ